MVSTRFLHLALTGAFALALASCSGGGGSGGTVPAPKPSPSLAPQNVAKAAGTVTIKFSHIKEKMAVTAGSRKGASAVRRSPKFVDPVSGSYLEFASYATCTQVGFGITDFTTMTVIPTAPSPAGTQTVTVPLVTDADGCTINVYVYEVYEPEGAAPSALPTLNNGSGDVIAYGEATPGQYISPGTTTPLTVTLSIAPTVIGVSYPPGSGEGAEPLASSSSSPEPFAIGAINYQYNSSSTYYAYLVGADLADDISDCYFTEQGVGVVDDMPNITLEQQYSVEAYTNTSSGSSAISQSNTGAYVYNADSSFDSVMAEFQTSFGPFPNDGPYGAGVVTPPVGSQSLSGWVEFNCDINDDFCGDAG